MIFKRPVRLIIKRVFTWAILICWSISAQAFAQDTSATSARETLWEAAKAIEEGQLDKARTQLDRVLKIDTPPKDLVVLINNLQQAIKEKEGSATAQNRLATVLEQAAKNQATGLNTLQLKSYLDNLSHAIELLVTPVK